LHDLVCSGFKVFFLTGTGNLALHFFVCFVVAADAFAGPSLLLAA
jgi:hypothetical protein